MGDGILGGGFGVLLIQLPTECEGGLCFDYFIVYYYYYYYYYYSYYYFVSSHHHHHYFLGQLTIRYKNKTKIVETDDKDGEKNTIYFFFL